MDLRLSFPLLIPFTIYSKWKLKMIASLKRQGLYEVSIGLGKESNDWINDGDRYFGRICTTFSPSLCYLIDSVEYPKDLWTTLDSFLGKDNEDPSSYVESSFISLMISLSQYVSSSIVSNEFDHDEEVSQTVPVVATLFDLNASSSYQEENIEEHYFSVSLEDTDYEK